MVTLDELIHGEDRRLQNDRALRDALSERDEEETQEQEYLERLGVVELPLDDTVPDVEPWIAPVGVDRGDFINFVDADANAGRAILRTDADQFTTMTLHNPNGDDVRLSIDEFNHPVVEELQEQNRILNDQNIISEVRITELETRYNQLVELHDQQLKMMQLLREDQQKTVDGLNEIRGRR